jgi:hypothetical protein
VLGPSAWRVVEEPNGSRYLRVCLSSPGTGQPSIPPGSEGVGATYGCGKSELAAPLGSSAVGSFQQAVSPTSDKCASGRQFAIHIHEAKYDPFKTVIVMLRGRKLKVVHRRDTFIATIDLKGLPQGAFTVKITGITFRGNRLSGSRTYHTCAPKPIKAKPKKLKK